MENNKVAETLRSDDEFMTRDFYGRIKDTSLWPPLSSKYKLTNQVYNNQHRQLCNVRQDRSPSTPTWAQERLSAIYKAEGDEAFTSAFDALIAKDVHSIVFNGETVSREEYKKHISDEKFFERSATVSFGATVEAPTPAGVNAVRFLIVLHCFTYQIYLVPVEEGTCRPQLRCYYLRED
jgi:hypothetical protein